MIIKMFRNILQHSRPSSGLAENCIKITYVNPKQAIKKNVMYTANYLLKIFLVCSATRQKVRKTPKDRAKKILFCRAIQKSSL
jgi:hypothetical protein